jgi:hypothetical protein
MWLMMAFKLGLGWLNICPFGETFTPPLVIFRDCVKLRQVEANELGRFFLQRGSHN